MKPYRLDIKSAKDMPEVVFKDFVTYEINKNGLETKLFGQIGKKYRDRLEIEGIKYYGYKEPKEELKAKKGVYKNDIIYLYGKIFYKTKDISFFSEQAEYDTQKEIIKSKPRFSLFTNSAEVVGTDLIYYRNKGKILAKNIEAKIYEKKRK